MNMATNELSLSVSRLIKASPEALYNAWLSPEMLMRFMAPGENMTCPRAVTDPEVGGSFEIIMQAGDRQIPHNGTYLELEPHSKIAFTWNSPFSEDDSEVRVSFTPEGDGTRVELVHVKFSDAQSRDNHKSGWTAILEALDRVAA